MIWWGQPCSCCMPSNDDTPYSTGTQLRLLDGQFTTTVLDSFGTGPVGGTQNSSAISWDGTNTPWAGLRGFGDAFVYLYLQSGQFSSTVLQSEDVYAIDQDLHGISWDGTNTPWCGTQADKLYLQSGQFTATLKDSENVSSIDNLVRGISWDGNTPWAGTQAKKLYLQSGQFTSTLKDSEDVSGISNSVTDISWDGTNTPWGGDKLYVQSGQFSSTLLTSQVGTVTGINTNALTEG